MCLFKIYKERKPLSPYYYFPPPVILHLSVNSIQVFVCETKANAHLCVVFTCSIVNGPLLPRGVNEQRAGVVAAVPFGNTSICSGLIA